MSDLDLVSDTISLAPEAHTSHESSLISSTSTAMSEGSASILAHNLDRFRHGHALWYPEGPIGATEIRIGDVGYVHDGAFYRVLNVTVDYDHPSNWDEDDESSELPETHQPLHIQQKNVKVLSCYEEPRPLYGDMIKADNYEGHAAA